MLNNLLSPFKNMALEELATPCHIIDIDRLSKNISKVKALKEKSGCRVLLAVKGFSAPYFFDYMRDVIDGISASGHYEARLGREDFGGYVQTYSTAFKKEDYENALYYSDAIVFNSARQVDQYAQNVRDHGKICGIRINPMFSQIDKKDVDPCSRFSRLGIPIYDVDDSVLKKVDGIHIHAMCEQYPDTLERLIDHIIEEMGERISAHTNIKWINIGGGQLIGRDDYDVDRAADSIIKLKESLSLDVIMEPCEGIMTECGYFATRVCDIVNNEINIAILDSSPICHMPDAVFRHWRHDVYSELEEDEEGNRYILSGPTCFAGDVYGEYSFDSILNIGDVLFFEDTASYTWVKNNMFNGIPFPSVYSYREKDGKQLVKEYGYKHFYEGL